MTQAQTSALLAPRLQWRQSLASKVEAITPFVDQLMQLVKPFLDRFGDAHQSEVDIEIAVCEALTNAVIHGNHEDPSKQVYVTLTCSMNGEILIAVRDEGEGFDDTALPDPTDPNNRLHPHGRGVYLMHTLMDEVEFEENGRVVQMRKILKRQHPNRTALSPAEQAR